MNIHDLYLSYNFFFDSFITVGYLLSWEGGICFCGCSHISWKNSSCWICICFSIKSMFGFFTIYV